MADGSNIEKPSLPPPTAAQAASLAVFRNVADADTVASMQQIQGIAQLIFSAIELDNAEQRLPPGVMEGLGAITSLAHRTLVRAGAA